MLEKSSITKYVQDVRINANSHSVALMLYVQDMREDKYMIKEGEAWILI